MDVQTVVQHLQAQTSSTSTKSARESTAALKKLFKVPQAFPCLLQVAIDASFPKDIRRLASIETRKLVDKRWAKIPSDARAGLRTAILQSVIQEQDEDIQHSLSNLVPEVASIDTEWTDLAASLMEAVATPQYCQAALYVIHTTLQSHPKSLEGRLAQIAKVLDTILADPSGHEPYVRNALITYGSVVEVFDGEANQPLVQVLEQNVPRVVSYLERFIEADNADAVSEVFAVCQTLLASESSILQSTFSLLMNGMIGLSSRTEIDQTFRCHALDCLTNSVQYFRSKLQAAGLAEPMARLAVTLLVELGEDYDAEDGNDESAAHYGHGLLELLLSTFPAHTVITPVLPLIGEFLTSSDADRQQAGAVALNVCVSCAPDFISTKLADSIPLLKTLLESPKLNVRKSILSCLVAIGESLGSELSNALLPVIEPIVLILQDSCSNITVDKDTSDHVTIVKFSLSALSHIVPSLETETANKYATDLMKLLVNLIQNKAFAVVHANAIGTLGSIASAVGDGFITVLDQVMTFVGPPLENGLAQQDSESVNEIYEAIGKIARAVGSQHFSAYVDPLISSSLKALESSDDNLFNDTIYVLWSLLADVYDESISTYLDRMMVALNGCIVKYGSSDKLSNLLQNIDEDDDDDEDYPLDGAHLMSDQSIELGTAVDVIGDLMLASKGAFIPYFEATVRSMLDLLDHSVEYVRQKAVSTLWRSYQTLTLIEVETGKLTKWRAGNPPPENPSPVLLQLGQQVLNSTLKLWKDELDSDVVEEIHGIVAETLRNCGPTVLVTPKNDSSSLDAIIAQVRLVLSKKHMCQDIEGSEDTMDVTAAIHSETSEYDWAVIDTAFDVVCALASALGPHFITSFDSVSDLVFEYANCEAIQERSTAIGTIAECLKFIGEPFNHHVPRVMELLPKNFDVADYQTVANTAYCAGIVCEKSTINIPEQFIRIVLAGIAPRLSRGGNDRVTDNAAGCLARVITRFPTIEPLNESLPKLVSLLPLPEDREENAPVYSLISQLYNEQNPVMLSLSAQLKPVLKEVLDSPAEQVIDTETRTKLQAVANFIQ